MRQRLFALVDAEKATGAYYVELLKGVLNDTGIDLKKYISNATDGASNMQGVYKGFSSLLTKELSTHVHMWCFGHILNLVMGDVTGSVVQTITLFSVLNDLAIFLKRSYKRMKKWEKEAKTTKRLQAIGETRWWAKDKALNRVFGSFGKPDEALWVKVIMALTAIRDDETTESSTKVLTNLYMESLCKYENILIAHIFAII